MKGGGGRMGEGKGEREWEKTYGSIKKKEKLRCKAIIMSHGNCELYAFLNTVKRVAFNIEYHFLNYSHSFHTLIRNLHYE